LDKLNDLQQRIDRILRTWDNYFWEYDFLRKKINFTTELKTNCLADVLTYLDDTLPMTVGYEGNEDNANTLHNITGFLQLVYVQQDLIDEILRIFKLNKSVISDKDPNRKIRNELIWHPIRDNILLETV